MIDTTVILAGIVWPRFPYEVLQHALNGDFDLILCPTVIEEARGNFAHLFPAWSPAFEEFLRNVPYEAVADPLLSDIEANQSLMRDITDIPAALSAIQSQVDFFVTEDKDYTTPGQPIHEKLHILLPGTFLNLVMGWSHEELDSIRRRNWSDLAARDPG
jgi:predicted nucleic acid-binding protein